MDVRAPSLIKFINVLFNNKTAMSLLDAQSLRFLRTEYREIVGVHQDIDFWLHLPGFFMCSAGE